MSKASNFTVVDDEFMNQFKDVVGTPEEQAERAAARDEMNRVYAANLTATAPVPRMRNFLSPFVDSEEEHRGCPSSLIPRTSCCQDVCRSPDIWPTPDTTT